MSGGRGVEAAMYAALLILPLAALLSRRLPLKRTLLLVLVWIAIFAVGLLVVGQRERLGLAAWRSDGVEGRETRIAMAADGHYWADVTVDGATRRMLIDSGATTTALSEATARAAGLEADSPFPVLLSTANGQITGRTATADEVRVGDVTARDLSVVISPRFGDTDVIGMNFLSRLDSWRVEDRTLIMVPPATG